SVLIMSNFPSLQPAMTVQVGTAGYPRYPHGLMPYQVTIDAPMGIGPYVLLVRRQLAV
ncbi:MAG: hypothetical protein LQ347_005159, partial [Umbilicaria vellea]